MAVDVRGRARRERHVRGGAHMAVDVRGRARREY